MYRMLTYKNHMKNKIQIILKKFSILALGILFGLGLGNSKLIGQEIDPTFISISEGLASPGVLDVIQDSYGLIWIATTNGLQRYDGYKFETFKNVPGKATSLLNNNTWGLLEDFDHNIWIASEEGISRFNKSDKSFTNYDFMLQFNFPEGSNTGRVFNLFQDTKKRLWAATLSNGLMLYDSESDQWNQTLHSINNTDIINQNDFVIAVTEDNIGGLWAGSMRDGLIHLKESDTSFRKVEFKGSNLIDFTNAENHISSLYADSTGIIWITARNGIYKFNPNDGKLKTLIEYDYNLLNIYGYWNRISPDPYGNIWISNNFHGILKFNGISDQFEEISIAGAYKMKNFGWNIRITDYTIDKSGIYWFGTADHGLFMYDPQKQPFSLYVNESENESSLSSSSIFGLLSSSIQPGVIYVGTRGNGLNIFNEKDKKSRRIKYKAVNDVYGGSVRSIAENDDGSLWLGTFGDGLIELDKNYNEINRYVNNPNSTKSISDDRVRLIKKDKFGNFWIGTNNGLNYFEPKTGIFKRIPTKTLLHYESNLINKIEQLLSSDYQIAGLLNIEDFQDTSQIVEIKEPGNYIIISVGEGDSRGLFDYGWLENNNNDTIWTSQNFQKSFHAGGAEKNRMEIGHIKLSAGTYKLRYISDDSHSYGKWNADEPNLTTIYGITLLKEPANSGLKNSIISSLENQPKQLSISGYNIYGIHIGKKYIWVATNGNGLNRLDTENNVAKVYDHDPSDPNSISSNILMDVYEDNNGIVWITSYAGLNKFDPATGQFIHYTKEDGLPTNLTESILAGDDGEMWISTQGGLSKMIYNESLEKATFINFYAKDGLGGNSFINQVAARSSSSSSSSSSGKFYFGGDHGLNAVSSTQTNHIQPELIISDLLISNKSVNEMGDKSPISEDLLDIEKIKLSYDQNNLSFEFSALHYANPQKNQYAHFLKGYDENWVYDNRRFASYTNLDPGEYVFVVRASNAYGVWNEEGKSVHITITKPWWQTWIAYGSYALIIALMIFIFDRFMRKRLAIKEMQRNRDKELAHAHEIKKAYNELKTTQTQLIQYEKMASLGELTAGIAHEIQNPLNFINNFSEVNKELLEEMQEEIRNGNMDEVNIIVSDIIGNEGKILHHGKRADSIVKDMLQHSRISKGAKLPTDINALADEYLRLAYHGLRAKDKSFNADFKTDLDDSLPKIKIIAQDMGRVLLNLINNAFYAVTDKKKQQPENYKPTVIVSTKLENENVIISVKDNGNGIPASVKEKIFQPFFTTKPTGEGTGLGLSLSYDIITKGHKGDLIVKTKEGEGTEFIIVLTEK
jgi:signal transduction histidine kinase/ligand-binding sensor domain-containing protein